MTRRVVYGIGLWSFLAATGMTLAAINIPEWLIFKMDIETDHVPRHSYGLHSRCTTLSTHTTCQPFPQYADCKSSTTSKHFCSIWRTTGFLLSFAVILELVSVVAFAVCVLGGKQKRLRGWKMTCSFVLLAAMAQGVAAFIVGYEGVNEERFVDGWWVGRSWILAVVAASVQAAVALALWGSRFFLEEEGGYELIPERPPRAWQAA